MPDMGDMQGSKNLGILILKTIRPNPMGFRRLTRILLGKSNRKAMKRNWGNQKANPALKTKTGNK